MIWGMGRENGISARMLSRSGWHEEPVWCQEAPPWRVGALIVRMSLHPSLVAPLEPSDQRQLR